MAKTRVGINGFGRIGRNFLRAHVARGGDFEIVAVNDIGDTKTMAHLLKYDSVLGPFSGPRGRADDSITVDGSRIAKLTFRDPAELPWGRPRRRHRRRVDGPLHEARAGGGAPRGRGEEGRHLGAGHRSRTSRSCSA